MSIYELQPRLLVVDDDEDMLAMVTIAFRRAGYAADATTDPRAALQWIRERRRGWDIVITDLEMPDIGGAEIVSALRIHYPQTASIIFTGASIEENEQASEHAPDAIAHKSSGIAKLVSLSAALLLRNRKDMPVGMPDRGDLAEAA